MSSDSINFWKTPTKRKEGDKNDGLDVYMVLNAFSMVKVSISDAWPNGDLIWFYFHLIILHIFTGHIQVKQFVS